ncbi:hypothetical protein BLNAU_24126 [Blattamonas nauphoetae]|uniref:Uncharacterized protein n=1 Tax=Blattamonas nauphoetae TaxID=2049346 RepID=A0ABQ9WNA0_9EUKA|nr:hypothetical protein BLNAU_24126 [Blattamonas nauphoetae]
MNSDIQILNAHLPLRLSLFANSPTVPAKITYQQSIPGRMQNNSDIDIMKTFLALQGLIVEMQETSSSFVNIQAFVSCLSVNCHPVNFFQVNPDYQRTTKPLIAPLRADEAKDEQKEDTRRLQRNLAKFIPLIHLLKDIALLSPDAATILSSHGLSIRISDFLSGKRSPSRSTQSQAEITLLTEDDCQIPPKDEEHAKAALGALLCTTVVSVSHLEDEGYRPTTAVLTLSKNNTSLTTLYWQFILLWINESKDIVEYPFALSRELYFDCMAQQRAGSQSLLSSSLDHAVDLMKAAVQQNSFLHPINDDLSKDFVLLSLLSIDAELCLDIATSGCVDGLSLPPRLSPSPLKPSFDESSTVLLEN